MRLSLSFCADLGHCFSMLKKTNRAPGEAKIKYLSGDLELISPGDFVFCAVTGRKIPIEALRYWSAEKQEAYVDAAAAAKGMGKIA